MRAFTLALCPD